MESRDGARVSVVMRTRNRPELLVRALDDVLAQSVTDWELVVVNDGGDPRPVNSLCEARSDAIRGRLTVLHNSTSAGMEAASNQGLRAGRAPFVAVHDDDDTWDVDFLHETLAVLQDTDDVAAAVRTRIIWEEVVEGTARELSREIFLPHLEGVVLADLLHFNTSVPISLLYRRSALESVGAFDESLPVVGDWECNLRLAASGTIAFIPRVLANWHQRPATTGDLGNSVVALRDLHRAQDRIVRDRALRQFVQTNGLGLPLYLASESDERIAELNRRIDELRVAVDSTLGRRLRRRLGRVAFWRYR